MSILSLTYQHDTQYEGTHDGIPIYDGSAISFHDWSFRTSIKYQAAKTDDKKTVMSQIIEGLRGDASDIAMDIGTEALLKEDGLTVLTEALSKHIFPKKDVEAKVLYKNGNAKNGVLSRQSTEPISQFISKVSGQRCESS